MAEVRWYRLLAPVHALAITFVLVFLAGAALDRPPEDRLTVRVSGGPAPDADLQVCMSPPEGWTAEGPSCRRWPAGARDVQVILRRGSDR